MTNRVKVSALYIHPVKSCRAIEKTSARLEAFGLQHDRRWMVVDENGLMLTQRKKPRMCLIQPEVTATGLILKTSSANHLSVDLPLANKKIKVKVWDDECQAFDAGDDAAHWLSDFLETTCRLVYFPDDEIRQVDINYASAGDKTAFSDGFPLLLISQASLDDLNSRLAAPVTMNRFRPNIVVTGCGAFAEDSWERIRIGETEMRVVKPCSRCVIPSINIETAVKEDEPVKTLVSYRKRDNKIFFGQNVIANNSGELKLEMPVEIIS